MECNKDNLDLIDFNKFNDSINKYNEETKGELKEFFLHVIQKIMI